MIELLAVTGLAVAGWLVVPPTVGPPSRRVAAAVPVGIALFSVVLLALLVVPGAAIGRPVVALWLSVGVAGVVALRRGGPPVARTDLPAIGWGVAMAAVASTIVMTVPLATATGDTWRYFATGYTLAEFGDVSRLSPFHLESRSLTTGAIHALGLSGPGYLRPLGPLIGLSTLGLVWSAVRAGTATLPVATSRAVAIGAVAALATIDRFVFTSLYLNGHSIVAVQVLLVAVIAWLVLRGDVAELRGIGALVGLLLAGAGLVRPDTWLLVAIVVLPFVLDPRLPAAPRRAALVGLGVSSAAWHGGVLALRRLDGDSGIPTPTTGLLVLGVALVLLALVLPLVDRVLHGRGLLVAQIGLWALVVVLGSRAPDIVTAAVVPTIQNVLWGGLWGSSLVVLGGLLVVAVAWLRVTEERALLFPLLAFVPLALLLALLREGGYRVGPGDSLNRSLIHVVPLAVLAVAVTAGGVDRGLALRLRARVAGWLRAA